MRLYNNIILRCVLITALFFCESDGKAQARYFQQEVNYRIEVSLDDEKHTLSGKEDITYHNRSDSTLSFIYFHLWPNAYKNNNTALARQLLHRGNTALYFADSTEMGYISGLRFSSGGNLLDVRPDPVHHDIVCVMLAKPLMPGDSVKISTPFFVKIPDARFSRLGHTGQAYFITQWYAKPAVFDNRGWHPMPYLDQGEFYSEFGSFDVSITLPENYVLAATGDRVNAAAEEEFLAEKIRNSVNHRPTESNREHDASVMKFPPSSLKMKTVRFVQKNVHDFAWFADKRFFVLKGQVTLPSSGRKVDTWVYFTARNAHLWKDAVSYVNDATLFYSEHVGDYPYNHVSAVDGTIMAGGGMEYPNITVIGDAEKPIDLDLVITHEVGHNWFYGILGSNERDHPFMDEGLNSFYEMLYTRKKYPNERFGAFIGVDSTFKLFGLNSEPYWKYHHLLYRLSLASGLDQPLNLHSTAYSEFNYGAIIYSKTPLVFNYLIDQYGHKKFHKAMQGYFDKFKFRHPYPEDLFATLNESLGSGINNFESSFVNNSAITDYKLVKSSHFKSGEYSLKIKNKGKTALPFSITSVGDSGILATQWVEPFYGKKKITFVSPPAKEISIDYEGNMPDVRPGNNIIKTRGFLKRPSPLNVGFVSSMHGPAHNYIYLLPVAGVNYYNGVMGGIALHNYGLFPKKFYFGVAPVYGFKSRTVAGVSDVGLQFLRNRNFSEISSGVRIKSFAYDEFETGRLNEIFKTDHNDVIFHYYKFTPYLTLVTRPKQTSSNVKHKIHIRNNHLFTDSLDYSSLANFGESGPIKRNRYSMVNTAQYLFTDDRAIHAFALNLNVLQAQEVVRTSFEYRQNITTGRNLNIKLRFFAGTFLSGKADQRRYYAFRASGLSGYQDVLFDNYFFGRNEYSGFAFSQFAETDGAMKVWTPLGQTADWLLGFNVKSPKILKMPLRVFADVTCAEPRYLNDEFVLWDSGLNISLWSEMIEVYVPVVYSPVIREVLQINDMRFINTIRFTFNIHKFEPKNIIRENFF